MGSTSPATSPLAPKSFPTLPSVAGVRTATAAAAIKYVGRDDVLLCAFNPGTAVAGVLTQSLTASAPVHWCRRLLNVGQAEALVVNAGNANAFTGQVGDKSVERSIEAVCDALGTRPSRVFTASTGVIGEPLDDSKIPAVMEGLAADLAEGGFEAAAKTIMTTDTFPKGATAKARIGDTDVTLVGIAKGSGMIAPDMATMLSFIFTDAKIPASVLQTMLSAGADKSFNCITVDSDTSTSDTLLLFATGATDSGLPDDIAADDPMLSGFRAALEDVLLDLAHQVVKDGEGASKFITIEVSGAETDGAAKKIGLAIANSPLVKTAIAGEDANWGRIVMAVGKAGERADRDKLAINIGGIAVARFGLRVDDYDETPLAAHMKGTDIHVHVDVGIGDGRATVWTCDLTHGYISINADYRS